MDIPACMEDHSDSEPTEESRKLSDVRQSLNFITDYIDKTFNVTMQPYYEHLKTPREMIIC
jgi:hypothetical protein